MGKILAGAGLLLIAAGSGGAHAQATSDRHQWHFQVDTSYIATSESVRLEDSWTNGGLSRLRHAAADDGLHAPRLFAQYHGRISPRLYATVIADYVDDASAGLDLTEAYLDWQPTTPNRHSVKLGAFYPPFSLENGDLGWGSPFTYSYSAINTWLGEEVRPIGAEWSMRRRLGFPGSPHELRPFAAVFYGNDPAGTLLFWRGWSLHDRQTRLNDRLPMPPMPVFNWVGTVVGSVPQSVEPFEEIDDRPGYYAGLEWRYARRALLQLAHYDNRAEPAAFRDGQWGWDTAFTHLAAQVTLPGQLGLMAQWMRGDTYWIVGARPNGVLASWAELVEDVFEAKFVMLTRTLRNLHRFSVRYDDFAMIREHEVPAAPAEAGHAWTFAYRYQRSARLSAGFEWLRVESRRDQWSEFYGAPHSARDRQLRLQLAVKLGAL